MKKATIVPDKSAYLFTPFKKYSSVAAFSDKASDMGFRSIVPRAMRKNRRLFLNSLGIAHKEVALPQQVHGSRAVSVTQRHKGRGARDYATAIKRADALVTQTTNVPLAVLTADCLPVFLCDTKTNAIGIVHAGWRGTRQKILQKTIALLKENYGVRPRDLLVAFGPAIRRCCYEVGPEFSRYFPGRLSMRNNKIFFDLIKENRRQALSLGVLKAHIIDCGICTSCDNDRFFSFRKEGEGCGRTMSVVMKKSKIKYQKSKIQTKN